MLIWVLNLPLIYHYERPNIILSTYQYAMIELIILQLLINHVFNIESSLLLLLKNL